MFVLVSENWTVRGAVPDVVLAVKLATGVNTGSDVGFIVKSENTKSRLPPEAVPADGSINQHCSRKYDSSVGISVVVVYCDMRVLSAYYEEKMILEGDQSISPITGCACSI